MIPQLASLDERLEAGLDRLLGEIGRMNEDQRGFRPRAGAWSATEVAHHLLLVQSGIVASMEKLRGRESRPRTLAERFKHQAVKLVLLLGVRVRNPAPTTTPDPEMAFAELEPRWRAARAKTRALLESMDEQAAGNAGFTHPVAGPLTVAESVEFLVTHLEHHARQLSRIRSHPDYPATKRSSIR